MTSSENGLFCRDLPSVAQPEMGKILVTGATGYVGGRLVPELLARGYEVRVMVRGDEQEYKRRWPGVEVVTADALIRQSLPAALEGIHAAYYLIHSLLLGRGEFECKEIQAAENFRNAAEEEGVGRIIYLGGLGDVRTPLSAHLNSRMQVAEELSNGKVPTTVLRTAVIIGSGGASYEIIEHLVKNLPVILVPRWATTACQPIGIRDVIKYLVGVLETGETTGQSYDIGGDDILAYREMMKILAELLGKKRLFLPCAFRNITVFSYFAGLLTPVPPAIVRALMEGIVNEVVCQNDDIRKIIPFKPLSYRETLVKAMSREEQDKVSTTWSDAYPPAHELSIKFHEMELPFPYTSSGSLLTEKDASSLFNSVCRIGGDEGWFHGNWLWRLRGTVDRILLGVGSARGRRSSTNLRIGDVVDFFRVEDLQEDSVLLMRAEMKLWGKAWLRFSIDQEQDKNRLSVNAYYQPNGLFGKMYWYMCLPLHFFIFHNLIRQIEKRS